YMHEWHTKVSGVCCDAVTDLCPIASLGENRVAFYKPCSSTPMRSFSLYLYEENRFTLEGGPFCLPDGTGVSMVLLGSRIYVYAGDGVMRVIDLGHKDVLTMEECESDSVDTPSSRTHCQMFTQDALVYVCGGVSEEGRPLDDVWVYDTADSTWQRQSDMPSVLGGASCVKVGDTVHLLGGGHSSYPRSLRSMDTHLTYCHGVWTRQEPMPFRARAPFAFSQDRHIVVTGHLRRYSVEVYALDTVSMEWQVDTCIQ
ncbi:hypothetical protein KIPB_012930, partial [Kipferlia bialata]